MDLSILIVSYNSEVYIKNCIESILDANINYKYEIIVIDNNSNEKTKELLLNYKEKIKLIFCQYNYGYSRAMNLAYKFSAGKFILTFNPDAELNKSGLNKSIEYLYENSEVGILAPYLIENNELRYPKTTIPRFGNLAIFDFFFDLYPNAKLPLFNKEIKWLIGTGHLINRDYIVTDNLYPEDTFLFWEEFYLCRMLHSQNKKIILFKEYIILHHKSVSFKFDIEKIKWVQKMIILYGFYTRSQEFGKFSEILSSIYKAFDSLSMYLFLWMLKVLFRKDKKILRTTALINMKLYFKTIFSTKQKALEIHKEAMIKFNNGQMPEFPLKYKVV